MTLLCIIRLPLLAATIFASASAMAGVYKWVDAQGVTHYSETPPPGTAARPVDIPAPPPNAAPGPSMEERARVLQQQRLQREQAEDKRRSEELGNAAQRRERCINARETVQILEMQRPIYSLDERGERVYMEDLDRPAILEAARRDIKKYCPE